MVNKMVSRWVEKNRKASRMKFRETETVELKAVAQDGIKKEIGAFANNNGGTVYVGVADDGTVPGVEDADGCDLQVSNMVRDTVKPDVTMFVSYETLDCNGKAVVAVKVQRGTNRPYYLAKKGLRPEGVYVRQGYSSVPATDAAIRQMTKETDGDSFEDMRFISASSTMSKSGLWYSLVHRDYSFRASTLISIYDDRIEFVSVGGLLPGLELEDLMMGVSACRNPHLANVFYRLQLIEAYGTGMRKIMGAYAGAATRPQIMATNNAFKIVLPNANFTATEAKEPAANSIGAPSASHSREDEILRFLAEHPSITRKEAQALLEVSQSTAGRILKEMVDKGQIATLGAGRALRYELV